MMKSLSLQDYELISAYLDDACTSAQKNQVEKRLHIDADFTQALTEFEHMRRLLRALPVHKVPRNFTLKADQAPARPQRFFLAPALNWAASLAALIFVVLFAGNILLPLIARPMAAPAAMSAEAGAVASDQAQSAPMIITWNQNGAEGYSAAKGMGGGGSSSSATVPNLMAPGAAPVTSATEAPGLMATAPQGTAAAANPVLGLPEPSDQGKVISPGVTPEVETEAPLAPIVWGEIAAGSLAILLAVGAFIAKRRR